MLNKLKKTLDENKKILNEDVVLKFEYKLRKIIENRQYEKLLYYIRKAKEYNNVSEKYVKEVRKNK
ncbi:hypothetical protein FC19_GL000230 [Liquorilactobacillus aquaticus DSM 21051]|uniref:Uncharacterized protein n=1 Tax=Liquorilactobacillus aquaticus DSM 21051 TaxID=1423725 RepID=A0A0R2D015_9LACO|nr:hypothetical protein [Liquorilactobacillus aquaticus]KRM96714.1 hypothetical protein FC19_GL000230 [Liquorilactobacillus aquaticus DSM 21051]